MAKFDVRQWAAKGAERRLLDIAEEPSKIYAAFPVRSVRGNGKRNHFIGIPPARVKATGTVSNLVIRADGSEEAFEDYPAPPEMNRMLATSAISKPSGRSYRSRSRELPVAPDKRTKPSSKYASRSRCRQREP
jgi:hypothetical protein